MKDQEKEFGPSSWAIDNKRAVYVLIFLITSMMGLVSYFRLPKENFPDITISKVYIHTLSILGNRLKILSAGNQADSKSN